MVLMTASFSGLRRPTLRLCLFSLRPTSLYNTYATPYEQQVDSLLDILETLLDVDVWDIHSSERAIQNQIAPHIF